VNHRSSSVALHSLVEAGPLYSPSHRRLNDPDTNRFDSSSFTSVEVLLSGPDLLSSVVVPAMPSSQIAAVGICTH
jgi:hypothetical protein